MILTFGVYFLIFNEVKNIRFFFVNLKLPGYDDDD